MFLRKVTASTVQKSVVVGKSEVHHGAGNNLAIDNNGTLLDTVETKDSGLRHVDDRVP